MRICGYLLDWKTALQRQTYVNGTESGSMSGGHILVHCLDGIGSRHLAVLLVHVVGSGAGIISDPDAEVLDLQRALLRDLHFIRQNFHVQKRKDTHHVDADDFSIGLLDLSQLHQEVPETGLCNHGVWRKYSHSVELGRWVCLGWQMAADDLVFCETTW